MGQGAESCGAYEAEYDPYEEGLIDGVWITRDGGEIHVSKMTVSHLRGAIGVCRIAKERANFECDIEKWAAWMELLTDEVSRRDRIAVAEPAKPAPKTEQRGKTVTLVCWCGLPYVARIADLKRGWGRSCCKSHAAIKRDYGKAAPRELNTGRTVKQIIQQAGKA